MTQHMICNSQIMLIQSEKQYVPQIQIKIDRLNDDSLNMVLYKLLSCIYMPAP